jgi:hypothetical protein
VSGRLGASFGKWTKVETSENPRQVNQPRKDRRATGRASQSKPKKPSKHEVAMKMEIPASGNREPKP